ncbi:MAG: hypothetical protein V4610_19685 [Pseudomonadota bacterium]|jgi:hypothetical protein|tara:strand:- start:193 stop:438 length:246 start_codon:yes stop_codon:yes gene_type:complete
MTNSVKLLGPPINFAVVQLPGRSQPGVVMQGDTLMSLVDQINRTKILLESGDFAEVGEELEEMCKKFSDVLQYYKRIQSGI